MNNLICKIFGHKPINVNAKRLDAQCRRCFKHLKVSYDMFYGETIVTGDYGNQKTFIWCDCGLELISSGSYRYLKITEKGQFEVFHCDRCSLQTFWDFDAPAPIRVEEIH